MTNPRPRIAKRAVHGVLLLDKPVGLSSNTALQRARRLYRAQKAGHTGTLDPLASGLLPLCFGAATKFAQASLDADKRYRATLKLGVTTSTGDAEGEVVRERAVRLDRAAIDRACAAFVGAIEQTPPMHSALKHEGRALYEYARQGVEIERRARAVILHRIDIVSWQAAELVIDVSCTKGTYVRVLAEDIGEALGCGAHLAALRRTGSGDLDVSVATTLDALEGLDEAQRDALLRPADALLAERPDIRLSEDDALRFLTGMRRRVEAADAPLVRVYGPAPQPRIDDHDQHDAAPPVFLGSAHVKAGELIADRLLSPLEVQALVAAAS